MPSNRAATRSSDAEKSRGWIARDRLIAVLILLGVVGVPVLVFGFGPTILGTYDDGHSIDVTCRVDSAVGEISSSRSTKGAGGAEAQVAFKTSCGNLLYQDGVTRANMTRIAGEVVAGERYRFSVGGGSFELRGFLKFFKIAPVVGSFFRA
ncbi:hypothetical protein [Curtobacterium citreum]|uniref:hypothetical protein n=1 Tax=Curtobacterium citreum TaxID=2036 RepID=UPI0007370444|nr:hypothetical protein [Curtobacterium citreum]KTR23658.1 hypothetical protein NS330_03170 [Curtobacterium citreum]